MTLPWFTDTFGNRLNLFDTVDFFDDWMHFMNWGLLTAGVLVLTLPATAHPKAVVERALAFGITAAMGGSSPSTSPSSARPPSETRRTRTRSAT